MPKAKGLERRIFDGQVELRSAGNRKVIEGHAAVYNALSQDLGGFVERIHPGAGTKSIREGDIRALYNHNPAYVLGRNKSGTLRLSQDRSGLYYAIDPPDTRYARDLMAVMERGDVDQSSLQFSKVKESWGRTERDYPVRELYEFVIHDVGPVTEAAYLATDSAVVMRMALQGLAERAATTLEREAVLNGNLDAIKTVLDHEPDEESTRRENRDAQAEVLRRLYAEEAETLAALDELHR